MGFAVVADEVRNLAQRCAQAARGHDLPDRRFGREIERRQGQSGAGTCCHAQHHGAGRRGEAPGGNGQLGSHEQARGLEQIGKAVVHMDQLTQRTAAGAEQGASAAQELTAQ